MKPLYLLVFAQALMENRCVFFLELLWASALERSAASGVAWRQLYPLALVRQIEDMLPDHLAAGIDK